MSLIQMVLKSVIILVSILLASTIVGGVIVVGHVLEENDSNTRNEVRERSGERDSEDDLQESSSSSSSSVPIPEEGKVVSIVANSGSNSYNPDPIEIKAGETVTWINDDSSRHTATSSNDGSTFDSDVLRTDETFSFTFDQEGEYPYFCTLHPSMVGTVIVTEP